MKKIFALFMIILLSACTISDTYYLPDVGKDNVGTLGYYEKNNDSEIEIQFFEGTCEYPLGLKIHHDCSPTEIASKYNIKTITEQNTQWILWPLVLQQRTIIKGIPYNAKKEIE